MSETPACRCVIVGDGGVFKTSLLITYAQNKFPSETIPPLFENFEQIVKSNKRNVKLQLVDTAGQEEYDKARQVHYASAHVILMCFSVVNRTSFENIKAKWVRETDLYALGTPFILVGTGVELRSNEKVLRDMRQKSEQVITHEQGETLAKEINAVCYMECSVINNVGVREVMDRAIEVALGNPKRKFNISKLKQSLQIKKRDSETIQKIKRVNSSGTSTERRFGYNLDDVNELMENDLDLGSQSLVFEDDTPLSKKVNKMTKLIERNHVFARFLKHGEYLVLVDFKQRKRRLNLANIVDVDNLRNELFQAMGIAVPDRSKCIVEYFDELFHDFCELETLDTVTRILKIRIVQHPLANQ